MTAQPLSPTLATSRVDAARQRWTARLVDTSRRNNLLFLRDSASSCLELGAMGPALASLLAGSKVSLSSFLAEPELLAATARAQALRKKALVNQEEKGLETLFVACGLAGWTQSDGGRPTAAPVLLVPVAIEIQGRDAQTVTLQRVGDVQANLVLAQALDEGFGLTVPSLDDPEPDAQTVAEHFAAVSVVAAGVAGWQLQDRAILSNFAFQKLAMVQDLQELAGLLAQHPLVAALAGDPAAATAVRRAAVTIDPRTFDAVPPEQEFLVTDADSSQQAVIAAVSHGHHMVVEGPPGTGKSQTITNLIATLAAEGKRVLFVAEKRAALEVVQRRLEAAGLGHLILDLHGADVSKRQVLDRVGRALEGVRSAQLVDASEVHGNLTRSRTALNEHVGRLHVQRVPWRVSLHDVAGGLLRLAAHSTTLRWRGSVIERLSAEAADTIAICLAEAPAVEGIIRGTRDTLWHDARCSDLQVAETASNYAWQLAHELLPQLQRAADTLARQVATPPPVTLAEIEALLELAKSTRQTLAKFQPDVFEPAFEPVLAALAPLQRGWWAQFWASLTDRAFRAAKKHLQARLGPGLRSVSGQDVSHLQDLRARWTEVQGRPASLAEADLANELGQVHAATVAVLEALHAVTDLGAWHEGPLSQLLAYVAGLAEDRDGAVAVAQYHELRTFLRGHGIEALLEVLAARQLPQDDWPEVFRAAWLASIYDHVRGREPQISAFDGRAHDRRVTVFQGADRHRLKLASTRLLRRHAEGVIAVLNQHPTQADLLRREVQKKTRHIPLRRLFTEASDSLGALFPCWMASPLSVSQLLRGQGQVFDVCIFDEASQVLPEDAITAIVRARQTVVAGDPHQLPPTTFFAAQDSTESDEEDDTAGYESLLDMMTAVAETRRLEWHYRSRDESLIAFSNRHIYDDRLVTFPGPEGQGVVLRHELVDGVPGPSDETRSSSEEVRRVVALILEHARTRPDETLGVIAFGIEHGNRLEAALWDARRQAPELDGFFAEDRPERFFVKNLERVQGDERDAIILSVGYGKDRAGRLAYRFGPLNVQGGHRRLNVAITRSRRRMTVVSSFSHADMDPKRTTAKGVDLLRRFLEFAASGGRQFADAGTAPIASNPFEQDVCNALARRGIELAPQWGVSQYRIDFVARHPTQPGRLVLAIECDGASYHSSPTARDRDRLRQQHLEALGWRFHRIWSLDWFTRRDEEIERAVKAFHEAVRLADAGTPPQMPRTVAPQAVPTHEVQAQRAARPQVVLAPSIDGYAQADLVALVRWLRSDGRLRTDDEIVVEMVRELGFRKRGTRIEAAIREAIARADRMSVVAGRVATPMVG